VSSVGRLNSRRPLSVTCVAYLRIGTGVSLKWAIFGVTWALLAVSELRRIPIPRTLVSKGKRKDWILGANF
jgi:hypothetical protein